jgi:hypothetical protein
MHNKIIIQKKIITIITLWLILLFPSAGIAKIAGHNVIFIHGFVIEDLLKNPSEKKVLERKNFAADFWMEHIDGFLKWSAADRIEGNVAKMVLDQAKKHSESKLCEDGCVLVTHSTGDLVARHFLAYQDEWLRNEGLEPLKIIATLDFGGAGGGTDIADKASWVVNAKVVPLPIKLAVGAVLGLDFDIFDYKDIGALEDLKTSNARGIANWSNDIPRLRFSGSGKVLGNRLTKTLIDGANDGVVPAHSSCGSASPTAINSCSNLIGYDGKRGEVKGPSQLLHNHFPVLMSDNYGHLEITSKKSLGWATYVENGFDNGFKIDFETHTENKTTGLFRWRKKYTYQFVTGSDKKGFSEIIYDSLNK